MEISSLIVLGIYTIIYLIVFFIQKSEIDKLKEINSSMKTFMDIFKIDEVKKYVELKNERIMMDVDKIINDNNKIKEIASKAVADSIDELSKVYKNQMGDEHSELVKLGINVIRNIPKEKQVQFIETNLPLTKRYFLKMLDDINKE